MLDTFMEMMSYPFMVRAFLVGSLVALCSALLGVSLVLKRYSMIGDGLSHVGFGALAIAAALNMAPLAVAIPVVVVAAVLLLRISGSSKIKGDAAIALISTGALAIGIMVISMTTGMNTDVYNYMFGSILAMSGEDVQFSILLSVAVLILYLFFYNKIFAITFDETFARATGVRANLYNTLIAVLTAVTIVLGMRMMGALLISSLIIFPALTSMRVFKTFKGVILNSAILSVVCLILGVTISYVYATPAGASVVVVNMAMQAVSVTVDHFSFKCLCDLMQLHFLIQCTLPDFDIKDFFHPHKNICKIDDLDHFYHSIELLFDLLKCLIITDCGDCHSGYRRIFCGSYCQTVQVVGFSGKQTGNLRKHSHLIFHIQRNPSFFHTFICHRPSSS